MPPKTFGCSVLTLPSRIEGYPVSDSTVITGMPKLSK
jgi:hypothetical protein